ncbi:MAG TPA: hypothetical protein VMB50_24800 [Myxococcales bacterium]|nr:hypothetical protein [Myxococcales bacterium]
MRFLRAAALVGCLFAMPAVPGEPAWTRFQPEDGSFSVVVPQAPEKGTDIRGRTYYMVRLAPGVGYTASCHDLGRASAALVQSHLDDMRRGIVGKRTLISQQPFQRGAMHGYELRVAAAPDGSVVMHSLVVATTGRYACAFQTVGPAGPDTEGAKRFLESARIN